MTHTVHVPLRAEPLLKPSCEHCAAGNKPIKMKRQFIHRVGWKNVVCREATLKSDLMA